MVDCCVIFGDPFLPCPCDQHLASSRAANTIILLSHLDLPPVAPTAIRLQSSSLRSNLDLGLLPPVAICLVSLFFTPSVFSLPSPSSSDPARVPLPISLANGGVLDLAVSAEAASSAAIRLWRRRSPSPHRRCLRSLHRLG